MQQIRILAAISLMVLACNANGTSLQARDGATNQDGDASGGVGAGGGTGNGSGGAGMPATGGAGGIASGGSGGNGGIAGDAGPADGVRDRFSETRDDGSKQDAPDTARGDAVVGDDAVVIDVRIAEIGASETGAAACAVAGDICTGQLYCSSGDDIDVGCRSTQVCQNGTWTRPSSLFIRCGATTNNACPNTVPTDGSACTLASQLCSYPTGTCSCATGCAGGVDAGPCQKPATWHCDRPPPAGCPIQAPQLGAPCANATTLCSYGGYCAQYMVHCPDGYWQPGGFLPFGGCA